MNKTAAVSCSFVDYISFSWNESSLSGSKLAERFVTSFINVFVSKWVIETFFKITHSRNLENKRKHLITTNIMFTLYTISFFSFFYKFLLDITIKTEINSI